MCKEPQCFCCSSVTMEIMSIYRRIKIIIPDILAAIYRGSCEFECVLLIKCFQVIVNNPTTFHQSKLSMLEKDQYSVSRVFEHYQNAQSTLESKQVPLHQ